VKGETSDRSIREWDGAWEGLYRVGGVAILVAVVFFRRYYGAELVMFKGFGIWQGVPEVYPRTVLEWFSVFQSHPFVALNLFGLRDLVNVCLVGLFYLALGTAMWRTHKNAVVVAVAAAGVGIAVYLATSQAFSVWTLSGQYAAAKSEAQRTAIVAAGEALLAIDNPGRPAQGMGHVVGLGLVCVSGLILSLAMQRSMVFGWLAAWAGILANAFMLGLLLMLPAAALLPPALLALPPSISAVFRVLWYVLSAIRLLRLGK
jgi:hypothetical protein